MQSTHQSRKHLPAGYYLILVIMLALSAAGIYRAVSTFLFFPVLMQFSTPTLIWLQLNSGFIAAVLAVPALIQWIRRSHTARRLSVFTFLAYSALYWIDQIWITAHPSFQISWWAGLVIMLLIWVALWSLLYSPAMEMVDWKVPNES